MKEQLKIENLLLIAGVQPRVIKHIPGMDAITEVNCEHWFEETTETCRILVREKILFHHDAFEGPRFERLDVSQRT